jgi:hypothetical protein
MLDPLTLSDLDRLEKLHSEATPGEWWASSGEWLGLAYGVISAHGCVASCHEPNYCIDKSNSAVIAAAHNVLPALLSLAREALLARDAAEAAYSACKASLGRQTAIADECAEEAQKYLAERDAALAVLRDMVAKWAPHSGLCCRYIDGQIVVCADSCACEELHREARELCGMEPYAAALRGGGG